MASVTETQSDLTPVVADILNSSLLSIDCEFERRVTYFADLSLLQVKHSFGTSIVDCKKLKDLSSLKDIFCSPSIKKILHSCFQDLQIFYDNFAIDINNFEDTQILANFCGFDQNIGYSKLVDVLLGVKVNKSMQNSNWMKRPLSNAQIEYAAIDVEYLREIFTILNERNRFHDFYQQDKDHLVYLLKNPALMNINSFLKKYDKILKKKSVAVGLVAEALSLRDRIAQKLNIPRRFLISDEDLLDILITKNIRDNIVDFEFKQLLQELIYNSEKTLDLQAKSCNNLSSKVLEKAKKLLIENCGDLNLLPQFVVNSHDLKEFLISDKFFKKLTNWRLDILKNIKKEVGL